MSATFYDLMKFAKTGIAAPSMTQYDKLKALAMFSGGFPVSTLTGIPPISFKSDGTPLTAWDILANMAQDGTPTPSSIIVPQEFGDKTANLFDVSTVKKGRIDNGDVGYESSTTELSVDGNSVTYSTNARFRGICSDFIEIPNDTTQISFKGVFSGNGGIAKKLVFYDSQKVWLNSDVVIQPQDNAGRVSVPDNAKYVRLSFTSQMNGESTIRNLMLNTGSAAMDYEPFGYKIDISCAGQTYNVYLGEVQTVRKIRKLVLTGDEAWYKVGEGSASQYFRTIIGEYGNIINTADVGGFCTHLLAKSITTQTQDVGFSCSNVASQNWAFCNIRKEVNPTLSLSDFKAWLSDEYQAGHPVTVWYVRTTPETATVNEPLRKISTYADELHSTDAGVTITTAKGQNALTIGTTLAPSEVSITGRIKQA